MIVVSLHVAVVVIILLALMQAGCTARSSTSSTASASTMDRLQIDRIYDSPTGPDLYRVKSPNGTTYYRQAYQSPLCKDVASHNVRP